MIIASKCPYRISLLGGSTDLDWFINKHKKGLAIGFSINAYSTIFLKERLEGQEGILNYFSREIYSDIEDISHPIIRECLKKYKINKPLELSSFGDNLSGGGLGSSSSFSVALVQAMCELSQINISQLDAANIASDIEINKLKKPIGRQDQYLCSMGGINIIKINERNKVELFNKDNIIKAIKSYINDLFIVNTGKARSANTTLLRIKSHKDSFESIKKIYDIANNFLNESSKLKHNDLIHLLDDSVKESWKIKKNMSSVMDDSLSLIETKLITFNFEIKKLLGAGGGGYFLVKYVGKSLKKDLENLDKENLKITKFELENNGSRSWEI